MFGDQDGADRMCGDQDGADRMFGVWQLDFLRETDLSFPWEKFPVASRQYAHSQLGQDSSHNSPIWVIQFTIHS